MSIYNIIVLGLDVFVHNLSPVKNEHTDDKPTYYNMVFQTKTNTYRGVSFNTTLYEDMSTACKSKSPVKIKKYRLVPNKFEEGKKDIMLTNNTLIAPTVVDYDHSLPIQENPPVKKISEIKRLDDKTRTSCILYLTIKDQLTITTNSMFHNDPVFKKEVNGNDENDEIPVTIWDDKIDEIPEDGTYEVKNAYFRRYDSGVQVLHINQKTTIARIFSLDEKMFRPLQNLERSTKKYKFPIKSVFVQTKFVCSSCNKDFEATKASQLSTSSACICPYPLCHMRGRRGDFDQFYIVKLVFPSGAEVMVYRNQVRLYFEH